VKKKREAWLFFLLFSAYLVLCFALLAAPEQGTFLFPLLVGLILLVAWLMGPGVSGLLILVASFVCLGLWNQWPEQQKIFLVLNVLQLWLIWYFLIRDDRQTIQSRYEYETTVLAMEKGASELRKETEFYQRRGEELRGKAQQRQDLAACAKDLGAILDTTEIQARLLRWTRKCFPGAQVFLSGLVEQDPLDAWILQRRQAVLCEDVSTHPVFSRARVEPGTKALMVAPLWVENNIFGGLRVESSSPGRFGRDELRTLDALGTLGSLTLDNAVLYHRIEQSAVRDGLTQLLTHRAFEERLGEEILRAGRYRYPLSLLMLDVDHFKRVNDTYGHPAGDEVLRRVSARLAASGRPVDVVARYGGEEFAVLLVDLGKDQAVEFAENLRRGIESERFESGGYRYNVTISIGVAVYPDEAPTPPQLVRAADQRLYQAKTQGRNRVVWG